MFLCLPALLACNRKTGEMDLAFVQAAQIEKNIKQTSFPDRSFSILDFGAKAGDSCYLNHEAINNAILECSLNGGGIVSIPAGEFYTGPIRLKSNVNLRLEKEAILKFSTDTSLYLPQVLTRWEGVDCYNYHPLIYAYGETNIALTGEGVLDAQGQKGWWSMCGARKYGWTEGLPGQNQGGRNRLLRSAEEKLDISQRIMTPQDALRPQMVNFYRCKQVLIEGITLLNSPFWVLHPLLCEDLIVRGVHIYNRGPNGDGCDPESCKNVLIEDCFFDTGDDCIAIKSGRNNDGRKWGIPSENIIVRNCKMKNGHGGVVIGSEISGGYRNLFVENCDMDSPDLDRVIRIKTNTCRGGLIENIFVRNIKVGQCREAVLKINLLYESREDCQRDFPPTVRNVQLENITCEKSRYGVLIAGLPGDENVYHIRLKNCRFNGVERGNSINGARDVSFKNLHINGELVEE
ncbi:MAG TPA: glycoside hydrolase family 28 protein [Bacteroidales bacterium]|nr:glycoside hydrolase family 28 protein [Bacteroidales bacterium]